MVELVGDYKHLQSPPHQCLLWFWKEKHGSALSSYELLFQQPALTLSLTAITDVQTEASTGNYRLGVIKQGFLHTDHAPGQR